MVDKDLYNVISLAKRYGVMQSIIQTQISRINELEQAVKTLEKLYTNLAYTIANKIERTGDEDEY